MKINEEGLAIIKKFEGLVDGDPNTPGLDPYLCPAGIPTLGYGACFGFDSRRITMDHPPISYEQAEQFLARDCRRSENAVARLVNVPITQNQFSALVSFVYNIGSGNFQASTLKMKLNRKEYTGAANEFWKWRRANGRILRGLVRRRAAEK